MGTGRRSRKGMPETFMIPFHMTDHIVQILATAEQAHQDAEARVERRKEEAGRLEKKFDEKNQQLEDAQKDLRELKESQEPLDVQNRNAENAWKAHTDSMKALQHEQRDMKSASDGHKRAERDAQKDVDDEYARLEEAHGGSEARILAEIKEAEENAADLLRQRDEHQTRLEQLKTEREAAEKRERNFEPHLEQTSRDMQKAKRDLEQLESRGNNDPLACFPPNMSKLLKNIQQDTRYRKKPIGPLGLHVRLLDSQWSSIIEKTFGRSLNGFVVTIKNDQNLL